jgi:molybdopterin synthase sulfur carrier subunit
MTITVKLFASFQEITGTNRVFLESDNVRDMLNQLVELYPAMESEVFSSPDRRELRRNVKVMINGRNIEFIDGLDTGLRGTDRIAVFPPVGGG